jgi:ABC-type multidrug transport system ATPase subunit
MNGPVWKLDRVTLGGRPRPRLVDVSLEIGTGITAILGHSGAGKTSLLNLLVGFEKPERGKIVAGPDRPGDRLPLFWVPPDEGLWPHLTVEQHLRAVAPERPAGEAGIAKLLAAFNLSDKTGIIPDLLSQGERSRLALARALASDAGVLVLDEPLVHVDPAGARNYWESLRQFFRQSARTAVVFSTHSPEIVLREAQQVVCLSEGRVVYAGSVNQLYYDPPDPDLAWCLGPANWISEADRPGWLIGHVAGRRCYRPEQVSVTPADSSALVVQSAAFSGSVGETELLDESSGRRRHVLLFVGAVPGAIPPLMGWTAVTGTADLGGVAVFLLLLAWQLPHFIAISLYLKEDYARGGMKVFALVHGDRMARTWIAGTSLLLLPASLLPVALGLAGWLYGAIAAAASVAFTGMALTGLRLEGESNRWARRIFLGTLLYLVVLMVALFLGANR